MDSLGMSAKYVFSSRLLIMFIRKTTFVLPSRRNRDSELRTDLYRALCNSRSLQEISCPDEDGLFVPELARISTIRRIFIRRPDIVGQMLSGTLVQPVSIKKLPGLAHLVVFER